MIKFCELWVAQGSVMQALKIIMSAVYTIKNLFLAFRFFVESCYSPKHSKKPESKNPPPQHDETPPKFHCFFANVNARSNLAGIIRVFGHVVRDLQRNHPTAARS